MGPHDAHHRCIGSLVPASLLPYTAKSFEHPSHMPTGVTRGRLGLSSVALTIAPMLTRRWDGETRDEDGATGAKAAVSADEGETSALPSMVWLVTLVSHDGHHSAASCRNVSSRQRIWTAAYVQSTIWMVSRRHRRTRTHHDQRPPTMPPTAPRAAHRAAAARGCCWALRL